MYKLLDAGFYRLKKNKFFWLIAIANIGLALFFILNRSNSNSGYSSGFTIAELSINNMAIIGFLLAMYISLFVGREHSDGAIKNKVISGYSRAKIYMSNVIISVVSSCFFELLYLLTIVIVGIPLFGKIEIIPLSAFALIVLDAFLIITVYSIIFNFISMLSHNITSSLIICILIFVVMFVSIEALVIPANAEEFKEVWRENEDGEWYVVQTLNKDYHGKVVKKLCETMIKIMPLGQYYEISGAMTDFKQYGETDINIGILSLYSLGVIVVINGIGIYLFKREKLY